MTKFQELTQSLFKSSSEFENYKQRCWRIGNRFIEGYKAYLDAPEGTVRAIPITEKANLQSMYSIMGAMNLEADGFWMFGILIDLRPGGASPERLRLRIRMKDTPKGFLVNVLDDHEDFIINAENADDFLSIYELLQKTITLYYEEGLDRFLGQSQPLRSIGFV